jgi:hypothetical protein
MASPRAFINRQSPLRVDFGLAASVPLHRCQLRRLTSAASGPTRHLLDLRMLYGIALTTRPGTVRTLTKLNVRQTADLLCSCLLPGLVCSTVGFGHQAFTGRPPSLVLSFRAEHHLVSYLVYRRRNAICTKARPTRCGRHPLTYVVLFFRRDASHSWRSSRHQDRADVHAHLVHRAGSSTRATQASS